MKTRLTAALLFLAIALGLHAQWSDIAFSQGGPAVRAIGPITPGDCAQFFSTTAIQDAGATCGTGSGGGGGISIITAGITSTKNFIEGDLIFNTNNVTSDSGINYLSVITSNTFILTANQTPTQGFTSGHIIGINVNNQIYDTQLPAAGFGTVTSISGGCGSLATNGNITTVGAITAGTTTIPTSAANFPIPNTDCGFERKWTNTVATTVWLGPVTSAGYGQYFFTDGCTTNQAVTYIVSPGVGTINGQASYTLPAAGASLRPSCTRFISDGISNYDVEFLPPPVASNAYLGIVQPDNSTIVVNTNGVLSATSTGTLTIIAATTPTQGFTNNHLMASNANTTIDSGVLISNLALLNATQSFTGATINTFAGLVNFTSTFQVNSNTMVFPGVPATLPGLALANAFTGNNTYSGTTKWTGSLVVPLQSSAAATFNISTTASYFVCLDPTSNAITVNLPGVTSAATYLIKDCTGQAASHNITVQDILSRNLDGSANFIFNTAYQSRAFTFTGSQWSIN